MMLKAVALAALGALLTTGAQADTITLRALLDSGYHIVSTNAVPNDFVERAYNDKSLQDELLIVLERADDVAFCHVLYAATISNDAVRDVPCFHPMGAPPATDTTAGASSQEAPPAASAPPPTPPAAPAAPPAASSAQ